MTTSDQSERKYKRLKREIDKLDREISRKEGAQEELLRTLQRDFECETLDDAQDLLEALQQQEHKLKNKFDQELEAFEEKWGDVLQEKD